ncbi:MAG: protein AcsF [Lentisphaerae bacterium]|nr:protein AcsF [Lentisphaerota bacterium]
MARVIVVTGKGGTGKTVASALIVKHLKEHARGPILALDADPDCDLGSVLGLKVESTIGDLREDTLKRIKDLPAGLSKTSYIEAGLHQVITEAEKVDLITMGRAEGPGCYCYINSILRKFADDLQAAYEWVVMDNEAGLEHLSRRTASHVDHLIVMVSRDPLSVDCAERIVTLVSDLKNDVRRKHVLFNGVDEARAAAIEARIAPLGLERLGVLPFDPAVETCVGERRSLFELHTGPAAARIAEIMRKMEEPKPCK